LRQGKNEGHFESVSDHESPIPRNTLTADDPVTLPIELSAEGD
jgi:hypothetical protein